MVTNIRLDLDDAERERIVVGSGETERVFRKKLYGDWGPFEEETKK